MQDLVTYFDDAGRPCQNFNGVVYKKYATDKYFRSTTKAWVRLHVEVWSYVNGKRPPKKYHVHHIDENKDNNLPQNLKLIHGSKHLSEHMKKSFSENPDPFMQRMKKAVVAASKWSATVEGQKYRKSHAAKVFSKYNEHLHKREVTKICQVCGKDYITTNLCSIQSKFCSNNCKSQWRRQEGLDDVERICECGTVFKVNKYSLKTKCNGCVPAHYQNRAKKYRQ
jgi:hypothetical protein